MVFCVQNAFHPNFWSASQRMERCFGPAPRAISSPRTWHKRGYVHITDIQESPTWLHATMPDPSRDDPMDDTSTGQPDARAAPRMTNTNWWQDARWPATHDGCAASTLLQSNAEPFTGTCPLCHGWACQWSSCDMQYVWISSPCLWMKVRRSQRVWTTQPPRTRILEKRMQKLADFGMFGKMSELPRYCTSHSHEWASCHDLLRQETGCARGITSHRISQWSRIARDRLQDGQRQLGYEDVEDRYASDVTFCDRDAWEKAEGLKWLHLSMTCSPIANSAWSAPRSQHPDISWRRRQCRASELPVKAHLYEPATWSRWLSHWISQDMEEDLGFHVRSPHFYRRWICQLHRPSEWRISWPTDLEGHRPSSFDGTLEFLE